MPQKRTGTHLSPCFLCFFVAKTTVKLGGADCLAFEATEDLVGVERVAFHQQLNQTSDRLSFRRDNSTGALELGIDQLVRCFFHLVQQSLAMWLVWLAQVNWSKPAHAKLTHHAPRDLDRAFDVVRSSGGHRRKQDLLGCATTK